MAATPTACASKCFVYHTPASCCQHLMLATVQYSLRSSHYQWFLRLSFAHTFVGGQKGRLQLASKHVMGDLRTTPAPCNRPAPSRALVGSGCSWLANFALVGLLQQLAAVGSSAAMAAVRVSGLLTGNLPGCCSPCSTFSSDSSPYMPLHAVARVETRQSAE